MLRPRLDVFLFFFLNSSFTSSWLVFLRSGGVVAAWRHSTSIDDSVTEAQLLCFGRRRDRWATFLSRTSSSSSRRTPTTSASTAEKRRTRRETTPTLEQRNPNKERINFGSYHCPFLCCPPLTDFGTSI